MSDYYPLGSNTKDAPWNQKEVKYQEWEPDHDGKCRFCGDFVPLNDDELCDLCFEPEQTEEEK